MPQYQSILLIKVPICHYPDVESESRGFKANEKFEPFPSLALATLCAFVDAYKTLDYQLHAVDLNIEGYVEPGVDIDISAYPALLEDSIKNHQYDVLGISAPFVFNERWVALAVELSRRYHPEAKIIIGGGYPTLFPQRIFERLDVDDLVLGEGESTFLHLLNRYNQHHDAAFEEKFPFDGYSTRNATGEIITKERTQRQNYLNAGVLPPPAWHYLDVEKYFRNSGMHILPLEVSRGCPYKCTYCCTYMAWGRWMRYKPVENAIAEIRHLKEHYGAPTLYLIDDNPTITKKWIKAFLTELIAEDLAGDVALQNVSVMHIGEDVLDLLKQAGCTNITIAVEAGSDAMQKRLDKNLDFNEVKEVTTLVKSKGFTFDILWLIGIPGESLAQVRETFDRAREFRAHENVFSVVLPYPGTRLYNQAKVEGLLNFDETKLKSLDQFNYSDSELVKSDEWTAEDLRQMAFDVRIELDYLNSPHLDTETGVDNLLNDFNSVLEFNGDHVIVHIIIGYLLHQRGEQQQGRAVYDKVIEMLHTEKLYNKFGKYLRWRHPILDHFNAYVTEKQVIFTTVPNWQELITTNVKQDVAA